MKDATEFSHVSVLLRECIEGLNIQPNGIYMDGTAGGAGHSCEIAKRLCGGQLIAFDQDPDAIKAASERLAGLPASMVQNNFRYAKTALHDLGIDGIDGALLD
ncbi:MAG: 16S rRNA (cytosine(1402)-N(4))-methyltransferase, partial [Pygmaiobacter sp.]